MSDVKNSDRFPAAYQQLRQRLAQTGWIALGSLLERNQPGQGGPRYQWSRRVGGKTITVALSAEQFAWLEPAIANQRELHVRGQSDDPEVSLSASRLIITPSH